MIRVFRTPDVEVAALQGLDLHVGEGELVALVGASGSGKSTLLAILSGLDTPTAGRVAVAGVDLSSLSGRRRVVYQRHTVGFVWQQTGRNLLPYLSCAENVTLPLAIAGAGRRVRDRRAGDLLEMLGVGHCRSRLPGQMSGGEQQRVAIAVALANSPQVLLADEPTGELDDVSSDEVFAAINAVVREVGVTALVVTHDPLVSSRVDRAVAVRDGRTASEVLRRTTVDERGRSTVVAQEYALVDRAGRLQLPREYVSALDLRDRVRLAREPDHLSVWSASTGGEPRPAAAAEESVTPPAAGVTTPTGLPWLRARGLVRRFGPGEVTALHGVDLDVTPGSLLVIRGRSGSGKTTLLNLLAGLDRPSAGTVTLGDDVISRLPERDLIQLRRRRIGVVFQTFGLVPMLTAAENVGIPLRLLGIDPQTRDRRVAQLLAQLGLAANASQRPDELSGGQQQRVAVARALANRPGLLIADEPTAQLDSYAGRAMMDLIRDLVATQGLTAVVATHDPSLIGTADEVVDLRDGRVVRTTSD